MKPPEPPRPLAARRVAGARRILVLRRRALGDILLTLPAVRALAESYPTARVELLVDAPFVPVVSGLSYVHDVLVFPDRGSVPSGRGRALAALYADVRRRRYDVVVDALGTPRTAGLALWSGARTRVGFRMRARTLAYSRRVPRSDAARPVYMRDAFLELAEAVGATTADRSFAPAGGEDLPARAAARRAADDPARPRAVAMAPGATWSAKAWSPDRYAAVARALLADGATVTAFWAPGEEALADQVVALAPGAAKAPAGDVLALARGLAACDLLVSTDSGARHVAIGLGVPTLGLFGPTDPRTATPAEGPHRTLTHAIECAPCQRTTCPLASNWCLSEIAPVAVVDAARALLAGAPIGAP
jgi:heptosyltransferase-2